MSLSSALLLGVFFCFCCSSVRLQIECSNKIRSTVLLWFYIIYPQIVFCRRIGCATILSQNRRKFQGKRKTTDLHIITRYFMYACNNDERNTDAKRRKYLLHFIPTYVFTKCSHWLSTVRIKFNCTEPHQQQKCQQI